MKYKHLGMARPRARADQKKQALNFIKAVAGEKVDQPKEKQVRGKRGKYNQPEAELRKEVIKVLRAKGCRVHRVENSIVGKNNTGLGDLWVANDRLQIAGWVELKAGKNDLQDNQKAFRDSCLACNVNYWVIRSVEEAIQAIFGGSNA